VVFEGTALGDDFSRNMGLNSTQALATNVTGIIVPLSGHWMPKEQPEFVHCETYKILQPVICIYATTKHKGNYTVSQYMNKKENSQSCNHLELQIQRPRQGRMNIIHL
jgi:hypothetical protein